MANPNTEVSKVFNMEQAVSVNSYFDVNVEGENVRLQVTTRSGATVERIVEIVSFHVEAYGLLRKSFPKPVNVIPQMTGDGSQQQGGEKKKFEPKPVPVAELPEGLPTAAEGGHSEYFKDEFDSIEITPLPDGKATVKFFKDGLKFPVGASINKWKHMDIRQMLQPIGDFDPSQPAKPRVSGSQYWVTGAEYIISSGQHAGEKSHYKNLKLIQANL